MKTIHDLAVWRNKLDGELYAFPLGAKDVWGDVINPPPSVDEDGEWIENGTIQTGTDVSNVTLVKGKRVRCVIDGLTVNTASWAFR